MTKNFKSIVDTKEFSLLLLSKQLDLVKKNLDNANDYLLQALEQANQGEVSEDLQTELLKFRNDLMIVENDFAKLHLKISTEFLPKAKLIKTKL